MTKKTSKPVKTVKPKENLAHKKLSGKPLPKAPKHKATK
jgi:hypothetical protein